MHVVERKRHRQKPIQFDELEAAVRRNADLFDYDWEEIERELAQPLPEGVDAELIQQEIVRAQSARG